MRRFWRRRSTGDASGSGPVADHRASSAGGPAAHIDVPLNAQYDALTQQIIRSVVRPGSIGVDVGAHVGDILSHIVDAAPDDPHIAVEPIPDLARDLRINFPTTHVHEVALDAEGGAEVSFHHVVTNPGYSGLRRRRYDRPDEQVELITVRTARLDELVAPDDDVAFLKIDVEGGELGVMQGGSATIERCRPVIVFEHGLGGSDFYGTRPEAVHDLLRSADLNVSLLQRWATGDAPLSRDEFVDQFESNENYYFIASADRRRR